MPPIDDEDWSDSDDESPSEVETSVLLGVPDGAVENEDEIDDAAVSRIGGYPAFLQNPEPSLSAAQCSQCSFPMELLVQLWCPFEESTMDRALYIFGCSRSSCQHKAGSIRAFRGLRFNAAYAEKLEKKRARQQEKEAVKAKAKAEEEKRKEAAKVNPFAMGAKPAATGGLFGSGLAFGAPSDLGSQLFGSSSQDDSEEAHEDSDHAPEPPASDTESDSESESDGKSDSSASLLQVPTSTPAASSPWRAAPAYAPAMYLSTSAEYVPPDPKPKLTATGVDDGLGPEKEGKARKGPGGKDGGKDKDREGWNNLMEGYENSLEVDHVFERFARRAGYEGQQCIRYELGGTPLPFAHDALFDALFLAPGEPSTTLVIQPQSKVAPTPAKRVYDPASHAIAPCPRCGARRVFECQLMPHLIHVLQEDCSSSADGKKEKDRWTGKSEEERRREVERILKGSKGQMEGEVRGMEWGTCLIFSCEEDCCVGEGGEKNRDDVKSMWAEELVLVQWEE